MHGGTDGGGGGGAPLGTTGVSLPPEPTPASGDATPTPSQHPRGAEEHHHPEEEDEERVVVHSVAELLWRDRTLRWVTAHQMKLILDLVVATLIVLKVKGAMGLTAVCGILSGLISVLRVWHFGR